MLKIIIINLSEFFTGAGCGQFAMFYTLGAEQTVGDFFYITSFSPYCQNLETVMLVKVNMHGGQDLVVIFMLDFGQTLGQFSDLMAEDDCDRTDNLLVRAFPLFLDKTFPDQMPYRFRTVRKSQMRDQMVKINQQI